MAATSNPPPASPAAGWSTPPDILSSLNGEPTLLREKTIVITGGASGLGAAFFKTWAVQGGTIIIGDIDVEAGKALVDRVKDETGNKNLHFIRLDVTTWHSQLSFFREAVKLSPHGGIDTVIANAGINNIEEALQFESPKIDYETVNNPPAPTFAAVGVNLVGALYTSHLALYYLERNPGSVPCMDYSEVAKTVRDRHLLLIGSLSSLHPVPGQAPYTTSKHGVLGLYRSLRITAPFKGGVRVNMLCPYFIDTPMISNAGRLLLAGSAIAKIEDAVRAAANLVLNPALIGRCLVVGPRITARYPKDEHGNFLGGAAGLPDISDLYENLQPEEREADDVGELGIWECYAHDLDDSDTFMRRVIKLMNAATKVRGYRGLIKDISKLVTSRLRRGTKGGAN